MKLLEMTWSVMVVENSYGLGEVGWVDRLLVDFLLFFFLTMVMRMKDGVWV